MRLIIALITLFLPTYSSLSMDFDSQQNQAKLVHVACPIPIQGRSTEWQKVLEKNPCTDIAISQSKIFKAEATSDRYINFSSDKRKTEFEGAVNENASIKYLTFSEDETLLAACIINTKQQAMIKIWKTDEIIANNLPTTPKTLCGVTIKTLSGGAIESSLITDIQFGPENRIFAFTYYGPIEYSIWYTQPTISKQQQLNLPAPELFGEKTHQNLPKIADKPPIAISNTRNMQAEGTFCGKINFTIIGQFQCSFQASTTANAGLLAFNKDASLLAACFFDSENQKSEIKIWQTSQIKNGKYEPLCNTVIESPILSIKFTSNNEIGATSNDAIRVYQIIQPNTQSTIGKEQPILPSLNLITNKKIENLQSNTSVHNKKPQKNQSWFEKLLPTWVRENQTLVILCTGTGLALYCVIRFGLVHKCISLLR